MFVLVFGYSRCCVDCSGRFQQLNVFDGRNDGNDDPGLPKFIVPRIATQSEDVHVFGLVDK